MISFKFGLAMIAAALGTQANALSCMRPDVARTFQWAAEADETYVVLLGQFDFDAPKLPSVDMNNPTDRVVLARFQGQSLGVDSFQPNVPLDVTMVFTCAGPWCGSLAETDDDILAFVERTSDGYVLTVDPCYGNAFVAPNPSDVTRVEACMRGEACTENDVTR